jgi:3-phosphoshikimate 1-carboxyvinyltransferase
MSFVAGSKFVGRPLRGELSVPGDKSISHRAVLFAAMAEGTTELRGVLDSEDVRSTIGAVKALGAKVELAAAERNDSYAGGSRCDNSGSGSGSNASAGVLSGAIKGWGASGPAQPTCTIDCGNSGTTTRLLMGVLAGWDISVELHGDASLSTRPMARVLDPLVAMGASYQPLGADGKLPLRFSGNANLKPLVYTSPVASAQVKSAIIIAGLRAQGQTLVREPAPSRNHTELMLKAFGVELTVDGLQVAVTGSQTLRAARTIEVPGDPSSAAFLLVAAALLPGSDVTVTNISLNPTRSAFLNVMQSMGADIEVKPSTGGSLGGEPVGNVRVRHSPVLCGTTVKACDIPSLIDEVPILALLATAANSPVTFEQVGELRVKESDRLAAIIEGLRALGSTAHTEGDNLVVKPGVPMRQDVKLVTHKDHRFAMTWTVAAYAFGLDLEINDLECMAVSYPGFLDDLERLK